MILDMASAATVLAVLIVAWLLPAGIYLFTTRLQGREKYSWAILLIVLTWPAYALYLFMIFRRERTA